MNKFNVGQKVRIIKTGKLGRIMQILGKDFDNDGATSLVYSVKLDDKNLNKMYTVHDLKETEDTLTAKEREYLGNIIKPFRGRVTDIEKCNSFVSHIEYIAIHIEDETPINLPEFEKNTLYQNMEAQVHYTLEELGL